MRKQKYTSIKFHSEALAIVNNYFGDIPFYRLMTASKMTTEKGTAIPKFWIIYEHERYNACDVEFCAVEDSPTSALLYLEEKIKFFLGIPIAEEIKLPIEFYL